MPGIKIFNYRYYINNYATGDMKTIRHGKNLRGKSFKGEILRNADFHDADLLGADFSFADLNGANFSGSLTGMNRASRVGVFFFTLLISLFSGYIAMLAGKSVQSMIQSPAVLERTAGYTTIVCFVIFAATALWKGIFQAINKVFYCMIGVAVGLGLFMYVSGLGSGMGAFEGAIALLLMGLMFIVGTIARATAGTLASNLLFLIVALGGGMFGKSLGGGIGTVIMAISCAVISKQALKNENKTSILRKIAFGIGSWFGTSFKNADLSNADFSNAVIRNSDFSNAILTGVNWDNAKKSFVSGDIE
jgi:hypothetical protein